MATKRNLTATEQPKPPAATSRTQGVPTRADFGTPLGGEAAEMMTPPWVRYEKFTVEEILAVCHRGGKAVRRRVLEWERAHQKRDAIILPLVNWNS